MTRIWSHFVDEEEYTEARFVSEGWLASGISIFDCKPVQGQFPDVALELRWQYPPADFFQPGTLFTVSDRLKSTLEEFSVLAEFFPIRVFQQGKEYTDRNYYFCNILACVDCLDLKCGEYTFETKPGWTGTVRTIQKLAIDEDKVTAHDLSRIAKGGEGIVCTSDRLANRIAAQQLTGMRLVPPEDWRGE